MKIALLESPHIEQILRIKVCLERMGHDVTVHFIRDYKQHHSYLEKKCSRLHMYGESPKAYEQRRYREITDALQQWQPEQILLIADTVPMNVIRAWNDVAPVKFWSVDPIVHADRDMLDRLRLMRVFVYDKETQKTLKEQGILAEYCPVGYNDAYENVAPVAQKIYDIVFIGRLYKNRIPYLDALAKRAEREHWTMKVFGLNFEFPYVWKKWAFALKHPALMKCIVNRQLSPTECANIYAASRICINIHDEKNRGLNPRTFEILATHAMQLVDEREDYDIVRPGEDLVVYQSPEDLEKQVAYYLAHPEVCRKIANAGYGRVRHARSLKISVEQILKG